MWLRHVINCYSPRSWHSLPRWPPCTGPAAEAQRSKRSESEVRPSGPSYRTWRNTPRWTRSDQSAHCPACIPASYPLLCHSAITIPAVVPCARWIIIKIIIVSDYAVTSSVDKCPTFLYHSFIRLSASLPARNATLINLQPELWGSVTLYTASLFLKSTHTIWRLTDWWSTEPHRNTEPWLSLSWIVALCR